VLFRTSDHHHHERHRTIKRVGVAVMLNTHVLDVVGSNLGRDTIYDDWCVSWFSLFLPGKCRESTSIKPWTLSFFESVPFHYPAHMTLYILHNGSVVK
jgi:hypothetical protein